MKANIDINRRNFYAEWFNLFSPPDWARRRGYGVCGVFYLPKGNGKNVRPILSVRR